jgi:hypothetical protein
MRTHLLAASVFTVAMGLAGSAASAAPLGNAVSGITEGVKTSAVQETRCWWRHGRRFCNGVYFYGGPRWGWGGNRWRGGHRWHGHGRRW